jgi:hypothetical protein
MEFNRNQYLLTGLIILAIGLQLRLVDTFVLNEKATQFLALQSRAQKARLSVSDVKAIFGCVVVSAD